MSFRKLYQWILPESLRDDIHRKRHQIKDQITQSYVRVTDRSVRSMHSRLQDLRGAYSGNRCFIMGNGPSLNQMDLNIFEKEYVWGSNLCYLLFERIKWRPKFYVAVDTRVIPDNADEINKLPGKMRDSLFFYPADFRYQGILESNKSVYWYNQISQSYDNLPYSMFSLNPPEYVYGVNTVTIAMLQLSVFLGFNPIYLFGCDTNYTIPKSVVLENDNPNFLISTEDDPNHFSPAYFGKNKKWHDPHVDRMLFHYEQTKIICDKNNIKIFNTTVGGKLEVFPRVNYLDLF